jgi:hypothetical protein
MWMMMAGVALALIEMHRCCVEGRASPIEEDDSQSTDDL